MRAYIVGSRSTHFNPHRVLELLESSHLHGNIPSVDTYNALIVAGICQGWLLDAYSEWLMVISPTYTEELVDKMCVKLDMIDEFLADALTRVLRIESVHNEVQVIKEEHERVHHPDAENAQH